VRPALLCIFLLQGNRNENSVVQFSRGIESGHTAVKPRGAVNQFWQVLCKSFHPVYFPRPAKWAQAGLVSPQAFIANSLSASAELTAILDFSVTESAFTLMNVSFSLIRSMANRNQSQVLNQFGMLQALPLMRIFWA